MTLWRLRQAWGWDLPVAPRGGAGKAWPRVGHPKLWLGRKAQASWEGCQEQGCPWPWGLQVGRGWVHLLQEGLGREASSEGEAEEGRKGHSAGRHGSRQQAGEGRVKRKGGQGKEKQKQPINFPKEKRGGRLGASVLRGGSRPRPPRRSATNVLSRNRQDGDSLLQ